MNCCNSWGQCTGGQDCAARPAEAPPTPAEAEAGKDWTPEVPQEMTWRDHAVILSLLTAGMAAGGALVMTFMTAMHRWLA